MEHITQRNWSRAKQQSGFTLVELIVVVIIIGILASVLLSAVKGTTDGPKAMAMVRVAENASQTISILSQYCGTSPAIASNPLPDSTQSATIADVIFTGVSKVAAAYKLCYAQSNVKALTESSQPGATTGTYNVQGYAVSFAGNVPGTSPLSVIYSAVPDNITLVLAQKYNPSLSVLATSDLGSSAFQYSTVTGSTRTDTIFKQ